MAPRSDHSFTFAIYALIVDITTNKSSTTKCHFLFYVCLKWLLPPTLHSKQRRPVDKMSNKIINFSPGPSKLPEDVRPQFLICFYSIMLQYKLLYCFRFCYKFNENCLTITERVSVSWRWVIDPQSLWKLSLMLSKIFDTFCKSSSYKIKHC